MAQALFSLVTPVKIFSSLFIFGQSLGMLPFTDEKRRNDSSLMCLYKSKAVSTRAPEPLFGWEADGTAGIYSKYDSRDILQTKRPK